MSVERSSRPVKFGDAWRAKSEEVPRHPADGLLSARRRRQSKNLHSTRWSEIIALKGARHARRGPQIEREVRA